MAKRTRLRPSNRRWPNCPGSVREEANYEDVPGQAAIDGTGSHELLELCLKNGVRAEAYDGQIIAINHPDSPNGWLVGPDRIERVQMCLDYVSRRVGELKQQFPGARVAVLSESKSDPGGAFGRDDWWGTVDITLEVYTPDVDYPRFIEVIDYKDGRGWVHVPGNTQLLSYLFGKMRPHVAAGPDLVRPFRPEKVGGTRITVVQPKTSPVVRYEDYTPSQVVGAAEGLAKAAHATDDAGAPLVPGKHCQWCKHKPNCNAESEESLATVKTMSNDVIATDGNSLFELVGGVLGDVTQLDNTQLAELADARAGIEAAFDKVDAEISARIEQGNDVPGYAMVPGRGSNVWNADEETVVKALKGRKLKKEDIFPPKLISPAQVLKLPQLTDAQKQRIEKELITYKAGKLSLKKVGRDQKQNVLKDVAQSDTSNVPSPELMFGDVSEEPSFF